MKTRSLNPLYEGNSFLSENAKRKEVMVTESGLQYEIIKQGKGIIPKLNNTVKTHYKGTLLDGSIFDSSYERGIPTKFPVSGVISGWTEALLLMPVGSKWKLFIPSDLAYGNRGVGNIIKAFETLIFELELLEIVN
jgi:FKBP-type peptidyl-prolyl cis-trans isomerase FklB